MDEILYSCCKETDMKETRHRVFTNKVDYAKYEESFSESIWIIRNVYKCTEFFVMLNEYCNSLQ